VVNEIIPTTNDLASCIADANASFYDPSYYTAPATSLLEFRNYGAIVVPLSVSGNAIINGTTTSLSLTVPTTELDNLMIIFAYSEIGVTISTPTGWILATRHDSGTSPSFACFYKKADGTEGGTSQGVVFGDGTSLKRMELLIIEGQNVSTPLRNHNTTTISVSGTSFSPNLTSITAGSMVVCMLVTSSNSIITFNTSAGSWTNFGGAIKNTGLSLHSIKSIDSTGGTDKITSITFSNGSYTSYIIEIFEA